MEKQIHIILADDSQMLSEGLTSMFIHEPNLKIVGRASNGEILLDMLRTKKTDIIIMDIQMPQLNGIESSRIIKMEYPDIKIIVLSSYDKPSYVKKLLAIGIDGYIIKKHGVRQLVTAINTVVSNKFFFSDEVKDIALQHLRPTKPHPQKPELSPREKEIAILITQEYTSREIAEQLKISYNTVEQHRKNIISKIKAKNLAGIVKFVISNKLMEE